MSLAHWIWLAERPRIGLREKHQLLERFGASQHIYMMDEDALLRAGCSKQAAASLSEKSLDPAYQILRACEQKQITLLTLEDSGYPELLRQIADPPLTLYVRGRLPDFDLNPAVTVVGTRHASPYGMRMAERFGAGLAKMGFTVVSGMALGADAAAMKGALYAGGRTVAVLAGGVDLCYPPQNKYLMGDILLGGAVISENPPGTGSEPHRFPIRNRILSGLSLATVVAEAPERSGALITARTAFEQAREVFAIPGPIDVPASAGCNALIRDRVATLVTSPVEIGRTLAPQLREPPNMAEARAEWRRTGQEAASTAEPAPAAKPASKPAAAPAPKPERKPAVPDHLEGEERAIAQALLTGADTVDAIVMQTGLSAATVSARLTILELEGTVVLRAGRYCLCGESFSIQSGDSAPRSS